MGVRGGGVGAGDRRRVGYRVMALTLAALRFVPDAEAVIRRDIARSALANGNTHEEAAEMSGICLVQVRVIAEGQKP